MSAGDIAKLAEKGHKVEMLPDIVHTHCLLLFLKAVGIRRSTLEQAAVTFRARQKIHFKRELP